MITIKEIAEIAKVSPGTVDRVIHNRAGVSEKTAEKIRKILKEQNFKINNIASKLAQRKKYNLSTFIPAYDAQNLFWKSPFEGIMKAKEEVSCYGILTSNFTFNQFEPQSYLEQFENVLNSNPDAIILVPTFKEETKIIVKKMEDKGIPYLFLNIDIEGYDNISFIGQDSYKSGYLAGKLMHLCAGNQPEFLIVKIRQNINNYHSIFKRIEGFNSYFSDDTIEVKSKSLNFNTLKDIDFVKKEINEFLTKHTGIKGIYVPSSQISVIASCIDNNYKGRFCLIGHDTTEPNLKSLEEDKVTFLISQKSFNQGYDAIHLISDYLIQNKNLKQKIFSPIEIITKENRGVE